MKTTQTILAICIAVFLTCGLSNAKMYKYVDENGVVTYQDYPPENISPDTKVETFSTIKSKVGDLPNKKGKISPKNDDGKNTGQSLKSKPVNVDYSKARVELFVTSWCKYCKMAASYLRSKGVPFTEYDIEKNKAAAKRKDRLTPRKGVPFAIVNGRQIYGFSPGAYENALNNF
ncbi:MAG: glutaredoxin family protein [Desulfobacteraceae bacterium]|nr:glutaredoxin family protein [Desulfobacteraceae bacterium]